MMKIVEPSRLHLSFSISTSSNVSNDELDVLLLIIELTVLVDANKSHLYYLGLCNPIVFTLCSLDR